MDVEGRHSGGQAFRLPRTDSTWLNPMPRRPREDDGGAIYHVMNRAVRGTTLFVTYEDYGIFENALLQSVHRVPVRLIAYCAMPNHWHLVVWTTKSDQLRRFMHRLTGLHAQRWHSSRNTAGTGAVYQGRYKSVRIADDRGLFRACRYVERNALKAGFVARAEHWRWGSLWRRCNDCDRGVLQPGPIPMPPQWVEFVNAE
jgi:putative transposase